MKGDAEEEQGTAAPSPVPTPLDDLRVLELPGGVPTSYCTKLLADAGADVVKVEMGKHGDPLRRWSGSGVARDDDAPFFAYLNTSKRSVAVDIQASPRFLELVDWADVVVEGLGAGQLATRGVGAPELQAHNPALVVVSISPFGADGPWATRPATEFTLQGWCGSTGFRGTPDRPPISVGGRVGEYIAATYAANAVLVAARRARRDGLGDVVDISMLECMTNTMQVYEWLHVSLMQLDTFTPSIEIPSVEPARNGFVGITTITGQQWLDFAVLVEQPRLATEPELCHMLGRWPRRQEVYDLIRPWLAEHDVEEIEQLAALFRIPATRLGNGANLFEMDHFRARDVFVQNPAGFRQPRVPWRMTACRPRPFGPAPAPGEHAASALGSTAARPRRAPAVATECPLPLAGVRVIEMTTFMAGPLVTHFLAAMGADVIKVESAQRPDGIRFAGGQRPGTDRPWEYSWLFQGINVNKRDVTLDLARPEGAALLRRLVATADIVVENYSPRVLDHFGLGWDDLRAVNPRLIMVRMPGFGLDGPWRDRVGFAQTMEMLSGMAWLTGYADGPPVTPRGPCDPLAGLHAAFALLCALDHRDRTGQGQLVEVAMIEAALNASAEQVVEFDAHGRLLQRQGNRGPTAAPQNVYGCRDGGWVALAVADESQWRALCRVLGDPDWSTSPELARADGRHARHDDLDRELGAWFADQDGDDVVERLATAGVPAAVVVSPPHVVENPQLRARRFFQPMDHPVTGPNLYSGLPMRLSRGPAMWNRACSPTLGQHNHEVLAGEIALSDDELDALATASIIGTAPDMA
jgi:crotonobetainyl-CoA:carnitine CoA-transferase CaiB-like acyl-CoA transferase